MLLFGLLGVQIPPRPGTGQLCPSQAELCSPQLWVRAAGMAGGTWGESLPLPAPCLLPCLPGTPDSPRQALLRGLPQVLRCPCPLPGRRAPSSAAGGGSPGFTPLQPIAGGGPGQARVRTPPRRQAETPASPQGLLPLSSGGRQGAAGGVCPGSGVPGRGLQAQPSWLQPPHTSGQ